jgi:hypothetical protein
MTDSNQLLVKAKKLAMENYETWGNWIIEGFTDEELLDDLKDFDTIEEWVEIRKRVAEARDEITNTKW